MRRLTLAIGLAPTVVVAGLAASAASPASHGARLLVRSASALDAKAQTVKLPLFKGRTPAGQAIWYVVTESSDRADAQRRGVNYAPRLANALGTKAVQKARLAGGEVVFPGTVDFSPKDVVVPSKDGFPPLKAEPGAVGDAAYSPLITTGGKIVLNASQIKNGSGQSDTVVSIDGKTVTLRLLRGYFSGSSVLYLHLDASVGVVAALEASTFAPNLNAAPGLGSDASTSARSAIVPIVNGPRGKGNRQRQGLQSAVLGEGDPLNITQSLPGGAGYSPLWDVAPTVWSSSAKPRLLKSTAEVAAAVKAGDLVSGAKGPKNASLGGLEAAGFISNCPTIAIG